ncbi:unnamed protein product [Choristocarpus tenellus]
MAEAHPEQNFLGLEIRRPVAATALVRAAGTRLRNLHFICCNANVDLEKILSRAASQGAMVETISIQFPDPCFKSKHHKRRVLQPKLVKTIEKHLVPGGKLFMQGDVLEVLEEMREMVREKSDLLTDSEPDFNKWMEGEEKNPMGVMTEREVATYGKGQRVYRCVFLKQGGRDAQ